MKAGKDAQRTARKLMEASLVGGAIDVAVVRKVIAKLNERKPRGFLQVIGAYWRLIRLEMEKNRAVIESAVELSPDMQKKVVADLEKKYGNQISTEFAINESLIGGMKIRVGSDVWDGSVANRVERLSDKFR